ncbi:hypothetical protein ACQW02_25460 [Humitalea sp. 24SJ18S-53]|uniref:hypothetical protein n=1 Tax=Humitalea sp. 24SJ18S-53 TaxID=3422307 RepID=UPI003D66C446
MQRDTAAEVRRQLETAAEIIRSTLAGAPSDFRRWRLTELQREVSKALVAATAPATDSVLAGIAASWGAGVAQVDAPLAAAGIDLTGSLVALDMRVLTSMREFATHRMADITTRVANRINTEIAQAAIGTQTPFEAAQRVNLVLKEGGMRRATTVVRDGLGRAYSVAAHDRQVQAVQLVPQMQKQWRRSGKLHSRYEHDAIDGQVRDVDQPFDLPNGVQLMFPRDPSGPIGETINCGCTSLPFMASWPKSVPARRPFTAEEVAGDRNKRALAAAHGEI